MENLQISALNMVGTIINEEEKSKGADKGLLALYLEPLFMANTPIPQLLGT